VQGITAKDRVFLKIEICIGMLCFFLQWLQFANPASFLQSAMMQPIPVKAIALTFGIKFRYEDGIVLPAVYWRVRSDFAAAGAACQ
jgi:hypothetical protein